MVKYLQRKNVPVDSEELTKETARLLIDREKIKLKREDSDWDSPTNQNS